VIDDAALGALAYRADGGLRDALTMLEQVAAFAGGPVDVATVDAAFGQTGREFARRLLAASLDGDATAALVAIDDASDAGTDMPGLIRSTIGEFRHLLVARINPELLARDLSGDDAAAALERARATPQARLIRALRLLADALAAARGSGNARLEIETATLRFILQQEDPSLDALAARVAALEANGGETSAAPPQPPAARVAVRPPPSPAVAPARPAPRPNAEPGAGIAPVGDLSLHKLRSLWENVRTRVAGAKVTLRAPLSQTTVHALDGDVLTLRVADRTSAEILKSNIATLRSALDALLGRSLDIRITVDAGRATPPEDPERETDLMRYAIDRLP
jgi:DNA polymerase-3 subunit gamma/tau